MNIKSNNRCPSTVCSQCHFSYGQAMGCRSWVQIWPKFFSLYPHPMKLDGGMYTGFILSVCLSQGCQALLNFSILLLKLYFCYWNFHESLARILKFILISQLFPHKNTEICVISCKNTEIVVIRYWSEFPGVGSPAVCRQHGFRSLLWNFNFKFHVHVYCGHRQKSPLFFSNVSFKMATWWPYWIFWFPDSNFSLALNIHSKLQ